MVAPEGTDSAQQLVVITRRESGFEREVLMPVTFVPLIEGC
jgi:protein-L-isoaspartate O-methyltransferase